MRDANGEGPQQDAATPRGAMSQLEGFSFPVHASRGAEDRAREIAGRTSRGLEWLTQAFDEPRRIELWVADESDWEQVAEVPVYGMPQSFGNRVIVSPDPGSFWQESVDLLWPELSEPTRAMMREVYGDPPDVGAKFADHVVVHEVTHLYHEYDPQTGRMDFPTLWLAELFCNVGMYGYVADREPNHLPILTTVAQASREVRRGKMPVIELDDMERTFEFGAVYYVIYQFLLTAWAQRIWDAAGIEGLRGFREHLRNPEMDTGEIRRALETIHPEAAGLLDRWPDLDERAS